MLIHLTPTDLQVFTGVIVTSEGSATGYDGQDYPGQPR